MPQTQKTPDSLKHLLMKKWKSIKIQYVLIKTTSTCLIGLIYWIRTRHGSAKSSLRLDCQTRFNDKLNGA